MLNRPRQIDVFLNPVTLLDGTPVANGVVIAYIADARDELGRRIFKRADIYMAPDSTMKFGSGRIYLDGNGRPETDQGTGVNTPVYGDGSYLLYFYANAASAPIGDELDDSAIYADPLHPDYPNTPDRMETFHASHEIVNARHFGAIGDANAAIPESGADDTAALQAAIDYCLGVDSVTRPRTLFIPAGTYRITAPLKIMTPGVNGAVPTNLYPCSLHIHGEKELPEGVHPDTLIYMEHLSLPAFMIQAGHGTIIRNIGIIGMNRFDFDFNEIIQKNTVGTTVDYATAYGALLNDNYYYHPWSQSDTTSGLLVGKCRDTRQSPYAAIVIDPFCDATGNGTNNPVVDFLDQYPGYHAYYNLTGPGTPYSFSTAILIEGCAIDRFAVGIMISPTGKAANAENIVIRHTAITTCRVGVAIAQNQTRGLNIENCSGTQLNTFVDNRTYGAGIEGAPPNIRGLALAQVKYLFNLEMGASAASFDQIYAEALLSLGFIGASNNGGNQHNVAFTGCDFNFVATHPMIDAHFYGYAGLMFNSCLFSVSGAVLPDLTGVAEPGPVALAQAGAVARSPMRFINFGPVVFDNCYLNSTRYQPAAPANPTTAPPTPLSVTIDQDWLNAAPQWGFQEPSLVVYRGVAHLDGFKSQNPDDDVGGVDPRTARLTFLRQDYPGIEGTVRDRLAGSPAFSYVLPGLFRQLLPPGATIGATGALHGSTIYQRRVSGVMNRIVLPVDGSGETKFFLIPPDTLYFVGFGGQVMIGDVIYFPGTDDAGNSWPVYLYTKAAPGNFGKAVLKSQQTPPSPESTFPVKGPIGSIGCISSTSGTLRNYIFHAPRSIVDVIQAAGQFDSTQMALYLSGRTACVQRFGRYHPASLGSWTQPTNEITITFPDTSFPFRDVWKRGDRITTDEVDVMTGNPLIPPGTYVTGYMTGPDRLVVSKQLTVSTIAPVRLFDADVLRVAMTSE